MQRYAQHQKQTSAVVKTSTAYVYIIKNYTTERLKTTGTQLLGH